MRKTVAGFRNILEVSNNLNLAWKVILLIGQKWFINNPEKLSSWTGIGLAYFMIFKWFQSWFKINLNSLKYFDLESSLNCNTNFMFACFLYRCLFYWNFYFQCKKDHIAEIIYLRFLPHLKFSPICLKINKYQSILKVTETTFLESNCPASQHSTSVDSNLV